MRDLETVSTALTAAETGHLVFATLHTQSAPTTIDRVIDVFPAEQQGQVRVQLAATLQGVVTQNLVPTADGLGRTAALEILIPDDAVRNLIRQAKVEQIYSVMQTNTSRGMQTMEQSLADLVLRHVVTPEVAFARSSPARCTTFPRSRQRWISSSARASFRVAVCVSVSPRTGSACARSSWKTSTTSASSRTRSASARTRRSRFRRPTRCSTTTSSPR